MQSAPRVNPESESSHPRAGRGRYAVAMWLIGLPLPIILIAWLVGGCQW